MYEAAWIRDSGGRGLFTYRFHLLPASDNHLCRSLGYPRHVRHVVATLPLDRCIIPIYDIPHGQIKSFECTKCALTGGEAKSISYNKTKAFGSMLHWSKRILLIARAVRWIKHFFIYYWIYFFRSTKQLFSHSLILLTQFFFQCKLIRPCTVLGSSMFLSSAKTFRACLTAHLHVCQLQLYRIITAPKNTIATTLPDNDPTQNLPKKNLYLSETKTLSQWQWTSRQSSVWF